MEDSSKDIEIKDENTTATDPPAEDTTATDDQLNESLSGDDEAVDEGNAKRQDEPSDEMASGETVTTEADRMADLEAIPDSVDLVEPTQAEDEPAHEEAQEPSVADEAPVKPEGTVDKSGGIEDSAPVEPAVETEEPESEAESAEEVVVAEVADSPSPDDEVETAEKQDISDEESSDAELDEPVTVAEAAEAIPEAEVTENAPAEQGAEGPSIAEEAAAASQEKPSVKQPLHVPIAIVVAILVALSLVGLVYSAFLSTADDEESAETSTAQSGGSEVDGGTPIEGPAQELEPITTPEALQNEIDVLQGEIDSLDEADFNDQAVSDQALEL